MSAMENDSESEACVPGDLFAGIEFTPADEQPRRTVPAAYQVASGEPANFVRFRSRAPLVMRKLAAGWPAVARWSDASVLKSLTCDSSAERILEEKHGVGQESDEGRGVLVLRSRSGRRFLKRDCIEERWPLANIIDHVSNTHCSDAIYARAPLTAQAAAHCDLSLIEDMMGMPAKLENCGVWIGSSRNITPFHYDLCHGFLVQICGTKTFTFVEPAQWSCMYPRHGGPELSKVDFEAWQGLCGPEAAASERQRKPKFADADLRSVTLEPGDVMYTPPFWWHHVSTGDAPGVSVLVPFDQSQSEASTLGEGSSHYLVHYS